MIRVLLVVLTCATSMLYLIGAGVLGYLFAPAVHDWLRNHPGALGGPARRALTVTALVAGWPLLLAVLGYLWWRERHRCPFRECAMFGWRTPGTAQAQALITVYQCPHRRERLQAGPPVLQQTTPQPSWTAWFSVVPASLAASTLGALASIPVPGPGFIAVYSAVALATIGPMDVLAEQALIRCAQRLGSYGTVAPS